MRTINFTPNKLVKLKAIYESAKQAGVEQFDFEGHELLTSFAKYLIEYLEMEFDITPSRRVPVFNGDQPKGAINV